MNEAEIEKFAQHQVTAARKIPKLMEMYEFLAQKLKEDPGFFANVFKTVNLVHNTQNDVLFFNGREMSGDDQVACFARIAELLEIDVKKERE